MDIDRKIINEYVCLQMLIKGLSNIIQSASDDGDDTLVLELYRKKTDLQDELRKLTINTTHSCILAGKV